MVNVQRIFETERKRGVLVIRPRGDAVSYRGIDVSHEIVQLLDQIAAEPGLNVVVDLSAETYFGTVIIGALSQIAERTRAGGGRLAVAAMSDEMQGVMGVMNLSEPLPAFPSLRQAVKAVLSKAPLPGETPPPASHST